MKNLKILVIIVLTAAIVSGCNVTLKSFAGRRPVYRPVRYYPVYQVCPPVHNHNYYYRQRR